MDEDLRGHRQLHDAALVLSARQQIDEAIVELSTWPFDATAAARMRQALEAGRPAAAALHRLNETCAPSAGERRDTHPSDACRIHDRRQDATTSRPAGRFVSGTRGDGR